MNGPEILVGIDVGTSRVKAVAFDLAGVELAVAGEPTPWVHVAGGADLDPEVLCALALRVCAAAAQSATRAAGGRVVGIGITGMGEAGVLAGRGGTALAPIRIWHDKRADVEVVRQEIGAEVFHGAVGMFCDSQPSLAKIISQRRDHPAAVRAVRFYSVPEWVARCLGGDPGSELSLASRTGLLDVVTGLPWPAAADLLGGSQLLGELQPAGTPVGRVGGDQAPTALRGAVIAVAGHDHQAAAFGAGAARDGVLFDSLGTSEALLRFTTAPVDRAVVAALAAQQLTVGRTVVVGQLCVLAGLKTGMGLGRVAALLDSPLFSTATATSPSAPTGAADSAPPASRARMDGEEVVLTLARLATPEEVWAATVTDLVRASEPAVELVRAALGEHREVLAAGGWFSRPAVLAAKLRQFPGLRTTSASEAGAAGAAYLSGSAAGLLPAADSLTGAPWATASAPDPSYPFPPATVLPEMEKA